MTTKTSPGVVSPVALDAMRGVVKALIELHRGLLAESIRRHEEAHQLELAPLQKLHLATTDPELAWLRPMSELIVEIDEYLDEPRLDPAELDAIRAELETLTADSSAPESSGARIRELVDASIPVAVAYVELERALLSVPRHEVSRDESRAPTWRKRRGATAPHAR